MKKKLDELTKAKLIYSGELLIIGLVLGVISFLLMFQIIPVADWKKWAFTVITLIGGCWIIIDFIWTIKSEKRRKKNPLIDKILLLPDGLVLITLNTFCLIKLIQDPSWIGFDGVNFFSYLIGGVALYVGIVYIFQAIYHWYHTHPMVYEMLEEDEKKEQPSVEDNNK